MTKLSVKNSAFHGITVGKPCASHHDHLMLLLNMQMPLDLSTMSEEDRQRHLERRRPKKKVKIVEDVEDSFDLASYTHLWKK